MRRFRSIAPVFLALFIAGCGGKSANPVVSYQPGDEKRSCEGLKGEIAMNEAEIARLVPYDDATGKNVALGSVDIHRSAIIVAAMFQVAS